jgi:hypothetical protein
VEAGCVYGQHLSRFHAGIDGKEESFSHSRTLRCLNPAHKLAVCRWTLARCLKFPAKRQAVF